MKRSDTNYAELLEAGTAVIADVFDACNQLPLVFDTALRPVSSSHARFAGPAYTIAGEAAVWQGGDRAKLAAIDAMPAGVVALWAGNDIQGACCFGDLLATAMQVRGCAGALVDGGVRDVAFLRGCGMPVLARYQTPAQGIGRWKVTAAREPVRVRGALVPWFTVHPGDILVADEDGAIAIPQAMLPDVSQSVRARAGSESKARTDIRNGMGLLQALEKYGRL